MCSDQELQHFQQKKTNLLCIIVERRPLADTSIIFIASCLPLKPLIRHYCHLRAFAGTHLVARFKSIRKMAPPIPRCRFPPKFRDTWSSRNEAKTKQLPALSPPTCGLLARTMSVSRVWLTVRKIINRSCWRRLTTFPAYVGKTCADEVMTSSFLRTTSNGNTARLLTRLPAKHCMA